MVIYVVIIAVLDLNAIVYLITTIVGFISDPFLVPKLRLSLNIYTLSLICATILHKGHNFPEVNGSSESYFSGVFRSWTRGGSAGWHFRLLLSGVPFPQDSSVQTLWVPEEGAESLKGTGWGEDWPKLLGLLLSPVIPFSLLS